jgi:hypothetical protein
MRGQPIGARALGAIAIVTVIVAGASCSSDRSNNLGDADGKFLADLKLRGVPTGVPNGANAELGHTACKDIQNGAAGGDIVIEIANLDEASKFTRPQAEVIVYWAIADLCPEHVAQREQHWRDGL